MQKRFEHLRRGYTTGSCVTAGASVGYLNLIDDDIKDEIKISLPNKTELQIPINDIVTNNNRSIVSIIKDGGDDPDSTDKMEIQTTVSFGTKADIDDKDYLEKCGKGFLIIKSKKGVGVVTRPGLDATLGKWAINIWPRKIVVDNLRKVGFGKEKEYLIIEINAINGAKIALKTLNPTLGVLGGISILGTTGIVEPYSNASYIKTIEIHIRCASEEGVKEIAFATGNRTKNAIIRDCKEINEDSCIRIGDFIANSLKTASISKIDIINIACMPGKLYKYANGNEYTHAHKVKLKSDLMIKELNLMCIEDSILNQIKECNSISEAKFILEDDIYLKLLNVFTDKAFLFLQKWAGSKKINLFVYNSTGDLLIKKNK